MRRTTAAPALLVLALLLGAAGCGDDPDPSGGSAEDPASSSTPTTSPSTPTSTPSSTETPEASVPPFQTGIAPQGELADEEESIEAGHGLGVTGVRTSQGSDFDRVVFDLGGTGTPYFRVEYVPEPRGEGSGDPVPVKGSAFLQVVLDSIGLPSDTGLEPFGDFTTRVPGTDTRGIAEIAPGGGPFEGYQQAFIGLTGAERPFRVFALTDPIRVVVDVLHE